jgi:hypothetical protein
VDDPGTGVEQARRNALAAEDWFDAWPEGEGREARPPGVGEPLAGLTRVGRADDARPGARVVGLSPGERLPGGWTRTGREGRQPRLSCRLNGSGFLTQIPIDGTGRSSPVERSRNFLGLIFKPRNGPIHLPLQ